MKFPGSWPEVFDAKLGADGAVIEGVFARAGVICPVATVAILAAMIASA